MSLPNSFESHPRHIFMTADTVGGVWNYVLQLCAALARFKIHVSVATMGVAPTPQQRAEFRQNRNAELYESTFRLEWMDDAEKDFEKAGDWLLSLASRLKPDLIHLNGYSHGVAPWNAPVVIVAHSCLLSWWAAVKHVPPPPAFGDYRKKVAAGIQAADLVIAPTRAMLGDIDTYYGPLASGAVIPNGRSARLFPLGVKEELILSAGRLWDEAKNIALLDKIASRLYWPLHVAGDNLHPNGSRIELQNAIFLGRLNSMELAPWFSRAGIYVAPVRYEPFGLSILEAALAGCALVLGDIPSQRENWEKRALFASPEDADALLAAIQNLVENPPLRKKLAASAAAHALHFSPTTMANRYLDAYRTATARFSMRQVLVADQRIAECV